MQSLEIVIRNGQVQDVRRYERRPDTTTRDAQYLHNLSPSAAIALEKLLRQQAEQASLLERTA